jgi:hypothetical protein
LPSGPNDIDITRSLICRLLDIKVYSLTWFSLCPVLTFFFRNAYCAWQECTGILKNKEMQTKMECICRKS